MLKCNRVERQLLRLQEGRNHNRILDQVNQLFAVEVRRGKMLRNVHDAPANRLLERGSLGWSEIDAGKSLQTVPQDMRRQFIGRDCCPPAPRW